MRRILNEFTWLLWHQAPVMYKDKTQPNEKKMLRHISHTQHCLVISLQHFCIKVPVWVYFTHGKFLV